MPEDKIFATYDEQIAILREKGLSVTNEEATIKWLKKISYYSLISGYKDIFKEKPNGNYISGTEFEHIVCLYLFDENLRSVFLQFIIKIEKNIKSLYSYSFCESYGDKQNDYLNVTNYNCNKYEAEINELISIIKENINKSKKYPYVNHYVKKHKKEVPLWVIMNTLTFGNISKMFSFSQQSLQSKIARNFKDVNGKKLSTMLNVISKFRNVCAHGERLYNFKTKSAIPDLPLHKKIRGSYNVGKKDLFNVCIAFRYLLSKYDFEMFLEELKELIDIYFDRLNDYYRSEILEKMGFPDNWEELLKLEQEVKP
ncbi:Abi family protein [uncultured Ruminococcus sp.]|uniref:Abi family protein n=1 Tax=uncultured Ruminococcus sp. TaxID=165186 RepID=UPI0025EE6982|nr:Abi family protein [uncultured Ruminococcus sp.]